MSSTSSIRNKTIGRSPGNAVSPERGRAAGAAAYPCRTTAASLRQRRARSPRVAERGWPPRRRCRCAEVVPAPASTPRWSRARRRWPRGACRRDPDTPSPGSGSTGPECNAHGRARRDAYPMAKHEHRIKDCAHGVGQTPRVQHRDGCVNVAPPAEESSPIGFDLRLAQRLALNDGVMRHPDLRLGGRTAASRRQERARPCHVLGLHEELGESRMCRIGGGGRKHELAVGGDLQVAHPVAGIHDRYATDFRVILRRDDHFQDGGDRGVAANEFCAILGEAHLDSCPARHRLVDSRPTTRHRFRCHAERNSCRYRRA